MTSSTQAAQAAIERLMSLHPKGYDLSLERVTRLLERLGNPQDHMPPVIHIAGTNGKGSAAAFCRALLEASGRICHVHTSPHLVNWHERFRLAAEDGDAVRGASQPQDGPADVDRRPCGHSFGRDLDEGVAGGDEVGGSGAGQRRSRTRAGQRHRLGGRQLDHRTRRLAIEIEWPQTNAALVELVGPCHEPTGRRG